MWWHSSDNSVLQSDNTSIAVNVMIIYYRNKQWVTANIVKKKKKYKSLQLNVLFKDIHNFHVAKAKVDFVLSFFLKYHDHWA